MCGFDGVFFNAKIRRIICSSALWTRNLTRMIFDEPPIFGCVDLMAVCSSALWTQNSTRMIFDESPIFGCVDLMVCFFNARIRRFILRLSGREIWQK
ncbi:hypothetical protein RclHR1_00640011 [Rhizophagus clarus]|uniref:Uncharacterized protein n=1 Tax=Rhizophagus clarus TaxID=94130 RepID=A0A2Z6RXT8_9GLOM|nr:hypothetical protein RclHR1_00640011 [Rhizophagus clarus]